MGYKRLVYITKLKSATEDIIFEFIR